MLDLDLIFGLNEAVTSPGPPPEREKANERHVARNPDRQKVVDLLQLIEQANPALACELADAWMERVAICEIDGGLSPEQAKQLAFDELFSERNRYEDNTKLAYSPAEVARRQTLFGPPHRGPDG